MAASCHIQIKPTMAPIGSKDLYLLKLSHPLSHLPSTKTQPDREGDFSISISRFKSCLTTIIKLVVKSPHANAGDTEMQIQSLGQEELLEEEMVTHSRILAWRIPWMEEPGGLQSIGLQRVRHD